MSNLLRTLLEPCVASIEIDNKPTAKRMALREYSDGDQTRFILWSDGSVRNTGGGIAIVWQNSLIGDGWDYQFFLLDKKFCSNTAEFFAIYKAVKRAIKVCQQNDRMSKIIIYSDSQSSLSTIRDYHTRSASRRMKFPRQLELAEIKAHVKELSNMGIAVVFRWVPGHSQIPGNERADVISNEASKPRYRKAFSRYMVPPSDGYLERTPVVRNSGVSQVVRHSRIEKLVTTRRTPTRRLYASRIQSAIHELDSRMRDNPLLETLDHAIDAQLNEHQDNMELSLSGMQA